MNADDGLDQELRHLARKHVQRRSAEVDAGSEWAAFQDRLSNGGVVVPLAPTKRRTVRGSIAAVAAIAAAVAIVGVVSLDRPDTTEVVAPPDTADVAGSVTPPSEPVVTTSPVTTSPVTTSPVTTSPDTTNVAGGTPAMVLPYFGRQGGPELKIDEFDRNGSIVGEAVNAETWAASSREVVLDGVVLTLTGPEIQWRCGGWGVELSDRGSEPTAWDGPPEVRSATAGLGGIVIATRDVCPGDSRWGDDGTRWELFTYDIRRPSVAPQVVLTRPADPEAIQYDDGAFVYAPGEMVVSGVSPSGRYVGLADLYTTETVRWFLVDLTSPGRVVEIPTGCGTPGDIVAPPRFVAVSTVVVARLCGAGGDVHVELVDLDSGSVLWRVSEPGLEPNGYTRTAELSALRTADGSVWVILTAGGDVEIASRTFVFHGDDRFEITRPGYDAFAFFPPELVGPFGRTG